ncbi:phosphotransferase [Paenibacillus sp. J22TS3]|uniref:phosphotransferase n=1 Tax=Paenibacillus sp. J22TS3 TaxID=2807192 RepID=UPI001B2EC85C|nr:phosphotransferase [Paenibacillus sp. J22TS3]GIP22139.1 hypothetical protein J22TS3_24140 [Paenibacillus sp. J22TS3]
MKDSYTKRQIREITGRYGLIPLRSEPVSSLYRRNAVFKIHTQSGTYAVKPFLRQPSLGSSAVHQIGTTAKYVKLLADSGFSHMPKWLTTRSGKLWTLSHGRPFYMTTWISGRGMEKPEDFEQLGRALATLHLTPGLGLRTKGSPTLEQIRLWQVKDQLFRKRMAQALQPGGRNRRWLKKYGKTCTRLSDRAWAILKSPELVGLLKRERSRPALIHNDITSPNVIISGENQLFIIDWDHIKVGSPYVDIAKALMNTTQFNPDFILALLKGYEEVNPLERAQRKLIYCLYGLPREAWQAIRSSKGKRSQEMLRILEQTWPLRLDAMKLLADWSN